MVRFQSSFWGLLRGVKMSISLQRGATFGPTEGPEMRPKRAEKVVFWSPKTGSEKLILGPWNFKKHVKKFDFRCLKKRTTLQPNARLAVFGAFQGPKNEVEKRLPNAFEIRVFWGHFRLLFFTFFRGVKKVKIEVLCRRGLNFWASRGLYLRPQKGAKIH